MCFKKSHVQIEMENHIKTYLYELSHPTYPDKYIGFTTQYDDMIKRWYDPNVAQPHYVTFMDEHGGLDSWNLRILKICDSREDAEVEKLIRINGNPSYNLNVRGRFTDKKSRPYFFGVKKKKSTSNNAG
jgi:hypothetical protein